MADTCAADAGWSDAYLVGHAAIDGMHREFLACIAATLNAPDTAFERAFDELVQHLAAHFSMEEALMVRYQFPPAQCHIDEHAAVMRSVDAICPEVAAGQFTSGRDLLRALLDWFPGHSDYLDSALSIWISKQDAGGTPLVFRRDMYQTRSEAGLSIEQR